MTPILRCPFCNAPAKEFDVYYGECSYCNMAWELIYTNLLRGKYKKMESRTCPRCGETWHSADTATDWKCERCGGNIPLNRMTMPSQETEMKRDEGSPKVTWWFKITKRCDWDLWLVEIFEKMFRKGRG